MRILVFGRAILTQPDRCTGQQLVQGFLQAGHHAIFCGNFYQEPYRWLGIEEATTQIFDLIIVSEHNDGYPGYHHILEYLNLKDTPILYQDYDVSYHPELSYQRARSYNPDGYLVGNKYFLGEKEFGRFNKSVLHLPYACSPQIHRKMPEVKKKYLLGFVGLMTAEREVLMPLLKGPDIFIGEGIFGDNLIAKTNEFHIMFHHNQEACKGLVPGRPWETAGCGTTLLMDKTSYEDFIEFFPNDSDNVLVYSSGNDIQCTIQSWRYGGLSILEDMGKSLRDYAYKHHTYRHRAEKIIEWVQVEGMLDS
jgi:hypothetical protein